MDNNDQKEETFLIRGESEKVESSLAFQESNDVTLSSNKSTRMQSDKLAKEISLKELIVKIQELWKFLLSKWMTIMLAATLGAVLGLFYSFSLDPIYRAETTFVLEEANGPVGMLGQLGGLASIAGIDAGGGGGLFQGENILQLYKSRSMIQNTLLSEVEYKGNKRLLIDHYVEFNNLKESWDKDDELKNIKFTLLQDEKFDRLHDSILGITAQSINKEYLFVSKPDKKLSIIKVEVKSKDEFFAKAFNDQIVKNVNDFYVQTKTKKALENLAILQHQTDSVRRVLNGAIFTTASVADATPNLNPTRQILRAPAQRSQFNAEANKAILTHLVQNLELAKLSLRKETPLIQVVDQPVFPLEMKKLGKGKAIIVGGMLAGFLIAFFLILKRYFNSSLANE